MTNAKKNGFSFQGSAEEHKKKQRINNIQFGFNS